MVFFTCNGCGESVKKNQVEKHRMKCQKGSVFCCLDCQKDFPGDEYKEHTKCISEQEKYSGKDWQPKASQNKNERKQQLWVDMAQDIVKEQTQLPAASKSLLEALAKHSNIPRKKKRFENFVANIMKKVDTDTVDHVWSLLQAAWEKNKETREEQASEKNKENESGEGGGEGKKLSKKEKKRKAEENAEKGEGDEEGKQLSKKQKKNKAEDSPVKDEAGEGVKNLSKKQKKKKRKAEENAGGEKKMKVDESVEKKQDAVQNGQNNEEVAAKKKNKRKRRKSKQLSPNNSVATAEESGAEEKVNGQVEVKSKEDGGAELQEAAEGDKLDSKRKRYKKKKQLQKEQRLAAAATNGADKSDETPETKERGKKRKAEEETKSGDDTKITKTDEVDNFNWEASIKKAIQDKPNHQIGLKRLSKVLIREYCQNKGRSNMTTMAQFRSKLEKELVAIPDFHVQDGNVKMAAAN